jgi:hypothetical protein
MNFKNNLFLLLIIMTSFFYSEKSELENSPFFRNKAHLHFHPPKHQIQFEGYLFKQGKILKLWNKRYYIVAGNKLYYKKVFFSFILFF